MKTRHRHRRYGFKNDVKFELSLLFLHNLI